MREPSVLINMIVPTVVNTQLPMVNLCAGVVITTVGPDIPTYCGSKSDVLNKFTPNGKLTRSTDETIIHAAAIAEFMPLILCSTGINKAESELGEQYENKGVAIINEEGTLIYKDCYIDNLGNVYKIDPTNKDWTKVPFIKYGTEVGAEDTKFKFISDFNSWVNTPFQSVDGLEFQFNANIENCSLEGVIVTGASAKVPTNLLTAAETEFTVTIADTESKTYTITIFDSDKVVAATDYVLSVFPKYAGQNKYSLSLSYPENGTYGESGNNLINLDVITPSQTYEVTGSIDPEYINTYGISQFIENINSYESYEFIVKSGTQSIPESPNNISVSDFGYISCKANKPTSGYDVYTTAIEKVFDDDRFKPAFASTLGFSNPGYRDALAMLADSHHCFVPFGFRGCKNDASQIYSLSGSSNPNDDNILLLAPGAKNTTLTGWEVILSAEVAYLRTITQNRSNGKEFAPVFGKTNGAVSMNPEVVLTRSVREKLLDYKINSIIQDPTSGVTYINKNKSTSTGDDVLTEEHNKRLSQKINRDLDDLLKPFLGEFNTIQTRSKVEATIKQYFDNNILNQVYTLAHAPKIVCDETNNTTAIIAANKLVVDVSITYNHAIYEVVVYHRAFDVNNEE